MRFVERFRYDGRVFLPKSAVVQRSGRTRPVAVKRAKRPARVPLLRLLREMDAEDATAAPDSPAFTFIDLFAGIGGLRLGFENIGGKCLFTSEWDANCQKTYALNFPDDHEIAGDIREYSENPDLVPRHDVLPLAFRVSRFRSRAFPRKTRLDEGSI